GLAAARRGTPEDAHAAAALVGLLVAALVAGSFDAVLLLAAPSFLVWTATGLLLPEPVGPSRPTPAPGGGRRRAVRWGLVLATLALLREAGARTAAIALSGGGDDRGDLRGAALLAPGEHRLQILLAERGDCDAARRAAALLPYH